MNNAKGQKRNGPELLAENAASRIARGRKASFVARPQPGEDPLASTRSAVKAFGFTENSSEPTGPAGG